jgi:hypothetical protein
MAAAEKRQDRCLGIARSRQFPECDAGTMFQQAAVLAGQRRARRHGGKALRSIGLHRRWDREISAASRRMRQSASRRLEVLGGRD